MFIRSSLLSLVPHNHSSSFITSSLFISGIRHVSSSLFQERSQLRNVAVIAHVDHGKTTLVDGLLKQSGTLSTARNRIMDSKDQERERGITILAKNTSLHLANGRIINLVDTPGHLDFSGEVERILQTVEGFILLVDANEGVKPGTRYVLRKALQLGLAPLVMLNKIDRNTDGIPEVQEEVEDLFLNTAEDPEQLSPPFLYGSGRDGYANTTVRLGGTLDPLFEAIFTHIPPPTQKTVNASRIQFLVSSLTEEDKLLIATGRLFSGSLHLKDIVSVCMGKSSDVPPAKARIKSMSKFVGVTPQQITEASFGDVISVTLEPPPETKLQNIRVGASLCSVEQPEPRSYRPPDAATFQLILSANEASWKEKEQPEPKKRLHDLRQRLRREQLQNTALQIEQLEGGHITLLGRGPLHLSVLIEDLRREGYEFELQAPSVVTRWINGEECEPWERITLEYDTNSAGSVASLISQAHGETLDLVQLDNDRIKCDVLMAVRLMLNVPSRFNRITQGTGVFVHSHEGFRPMVSGVTQRTTGTLVALEEGEVQSYSLSGLASHGTFFVQPGDYVYTGQIIGENQRMSRQDMPVNVTRRNEQLGGMRANSVDASRKRSKGFKAITLTLEDAMAWVTCDEFITVTPKTIRIRLPGFAGKTSIRRTKG